MGHGLHGPGAESPVSLGWGQWAMAFVGQAAPQTPLALGITSGVAGAPSSETMRAADAVFGSTNAAPLFPVTQSPLVVNYGFSGVSAGVNAPATGSTGTITPALSSIGTAFGSAMDRVFLGGLGSAVADGGLAVLAGLSSSDVSSNTGAESDTKWTAKEVREILRMLDPTPPGRWADKLHIVGDAGDHWWWVYAFTGHYPTLDIDYTFDTFLKSITAHVPANWTSLQVAEFIYRNIAGDQKLHDALLNELKNPSDVELAQQAARFAEYSKGAKEIAAALKELVDRACL